MSSQPGVSTSGFRTVKSASIRSPETTSSISFTERSWPTASGVIDSGKTTVSFSGRTGSFIRSGVLMVRSPDPADDDRSGLPAWGPLGDRKRDPQHAGLVDRACGRRGDVVSERDPALEPAVVDLRLLVDLPVHTRPGPLPRDRQRPLGDCDLDRLGVDACELDDDDELIRVVRDEAVDRGPEPVPEAREAGHLPEVGEELLDLSLQA